MVAHKSPKLVGVGSNPTIPAKVCSTCGIKKDITEFNKNKCKKDGYSYICTLCQKEYNKQHYINNSTIYKERARKRKLELKEWFKSLKKTLKCENCDENRWYVLDFHHEDPSEKDITVSSAVQKCKSKDYILKEINKCTVLCSNCHRELHYLLSS